MKNNPYLDLYSIMANATEVKPAFYLGKVVSELPKLQVKLEDITLNTEDLMIDQWLLDRSTLEWVAYEEDAEHSHDITHVVEGGSSINVAGGLHKHKFLEPLKNILKAGDTVVLLPTDSRFIIISKVVSL